MQPFSTPVSRPQKLRITGATALISAFLIGPLAGIAHAAAVVVPLGTASAFSVLAGSTVTNTGTTTIERNVGVSPGTAITGGSTMTVGGTYHQANAVAGSAKNDLTTGYTNAAGQTPPNALDPELGGETLVGGVYNRASAMGLTGVLTLDGQNDPDSVWVFQAGTTLTTASASSIVLINGADPCNVFWQIGSSATLGTGSSFVGTVMADQTITMNTGATLQGRVLARIGAVNLHANVITTPNCSADVEVARGTTAPTTTSPDDNNGGGGGGNGNGNGNGNGGGGNGNGGGNNSQVPSTPTGGVDTGRTGPVSPVHEAGTSLIGWTLAVVFGGVAIAAVHRRRRA